MTDAHHEDSLMPFRSTLESDGAQFAGHVPALAPTAPGRPASRSNVGALAARQSPAADAIQDRDRTRCFEPVSLPWSAQGKRRHTGRPAAPFHTVSPPGT